MNMNKLRELGNTARAKMKDGDDSGLVELFRALEEAGRGAQPLDIALISRNTNTGHYDIHAMNASNNTGPFQSTMNFHEALDWLKTRFDKEGKER